MSEEKREENCVCVPYDEWTKKLLSFIIINSFTRAKTSPLTSSSVHEPHIIIIIITKRIIKEDRFLKFTGIDDAEEVQRIFVGIYNERREEKKKKKSRFIRPKILSSPLLVLLVLVLVLLWWRWWRSRHRKRRTGQRRALAKVVAFVAVENPKRKLFHVRR